MAIKTREDPSELDYRKRIYEVYSTKFQDASHSFDVASSLRWGKAYKHYLRGWLPSSKEAAIVDVACGSGKLLHFFKEQGYTRIEGVEISPEQVQLARQIVPAITEQDATEFLKRRPESYDLITALDFIEHQTKSEVLPFLETAFEALRPGGCLILQMPNADSPMVGSVRYGDFTHEVCFNSNSLSRLLKLVNFKEVEAREVGPVAWGHSAASTVRALVWKSVRLMLKVCNLAETASPGSGVFTRVFLIQARK
jgi:2-polyprenyl-3-methyl-5-hydroxy-6-metoxy-1,4-benzoquinol methylase